MKRAFVCMIFLTVLVATPATSPGMGMEDDPVLAMFLMDKLEMRFKDDDNYLVFDAEGWIGRDLDKFRFRAEGDVHDGTVEEMELEAFYSRAVDPNWDLLVGARRDVSNEPGVPDRNWLALGVAGLAPYFIELDAVAYLGERGRAGLRLDAEYELMLTQRLVLVPELEADLYAKTDPATKTGAGLSKTSLGVRLRYEIVREFAPYIGVDWTKLHGRTEDFARDEGDDFDNVRFVTGISFWF